MKSPICEMFDIEFPMLAFSHCRDVVAAVSKAGGMGVLGAVGHSPEQLEIDLNWIDKNWLSLWDSIRLPEIPLMPYLIEILLWKLLSI